MIPPNNPVSAICRISLFWITLVFCGFLPAGGLAQSPNDGVSLEEGFRQPPRDARPHTYWLWLNGHFDPEAAKEELAAMKTAGLGGVLLFEMGARGDKTRMPPAGPAFLSPAWVGQLRVATQQAKALGLQVDLSVISSWDLGGPWITPEHASKALYSTEASVPGGAAIDLPLPFPQAEVAAPMGEDGRPAFWTDVAVLAVHNPRRLPGHDFVIQLDPEGVHSLREVVLDNGRPNAPGKVAETMTPVREFSVAVSETGTLDADFREVVRGELPATPGPVRFSLPSGTRARYLRLRLISGHDPSRSHWTFAELEAFDTDGINVAGSRSVHPLRNGARLVRAPVPLTYGEWNAGKIIDGSRTGPGGVFASAGLPPFDLADPNEVVDLTDHVDREGRLRWNAPAGPWTILRYVCMVTGERLKVPTPASDGFATDHLSAEATRIDLDHVIARLREGLGDLRTSGITSLYLASYEVIGKVWSPVFAKEFQRRRGYRLERFLPAVFGARIENEQTTDRFLFDYEKTLGEVLTDAYYRTAREIAHAAGLLIKSEAGGPGPPIHSPPVDALEANGAIDQIQGEFWPRWPDVDSLWVVKEPASAGHVYGRPIVHLESFTSFHHWAEGPVDLKPAADRVLSEGGNHFVWHTWTHQTSDAGLPGWAYNAGTHLNRSVTWWDEAPPFLSYLARASFLMQRGRSAADVLYYEGDGGAHFVGPRHNPPGLGPGFDYDVINTEGILNRLQCRDGRLVLPDGTTYRLLVLPTRPDINPAVLAKVETLVAAGATVLGPRPVRATGLEGFPQSDERVRAIAGRLWRDEPHRGTRIVQTGVSEREALARLGVTPDFAGSEALDYAHRHDEQGEIYFIRNKKDQPVNETVTFRTTGLSPEFWDPVTGTIQPGAVFRDVSGGTELPLRLAAHGSVFVVFRKHSDPNHATAVTGDAVLEARSGRTSLVAGQNGDYAVTFGSSRQAPITVSDLPASIALNGKWDLSFASPLGNPAPLELTRVDGWTRDVSPAVKYFAGTGIYRTTVTVERAWRLRAQRVTLELGNLWAIGEVRVNGAALGVVWTPPFSVDCTDALRDGQNEIVVRVTNTWHNRLVGESLGKIPQATRTNIINSQGKPWQQLEPIESGLFGPVLLRPFAIREIPSAVADASSP